MIHYNVWFALKAEVDEPHGLQVVEDFLRQLAAEREIAHFRLLRNTGKERRTNMPRFHAIIEFTDDDALARAMKNQAQRGVHDGAHGRVVEMVREFRVEIFREISSALPTMEYACEI